MYKSEDFFDKVSSKSKLQLNQSAKKVIQITREYIAWDKNLLDLGCGSGSITNVLAKEVKVIEAVDISSAML
jgi:ubiquinone/menaquinone biosynthesis C-methylase UbiE